MTMTAHSKDRRGLSEEWSEAAISAARNLGLAADVPELSAEHWQRVLASVEARMRMRGVEAPAGWRDQLATQFGRDGDRYDGPES